MQCAAHLVLCVLSPFIHPSNKQVSITSALLSALNSTLLILPAPQSSWSTGHLSAVLLWNGNSARYSYSRFQPTVARGVVHGCGPGPRGRWESLPCILLKNLTPIFAEETRLKDWHFPLAAAFFWYFSLFLFLQFSPFFTSHGTYI